MNNDLIVRGYKDVELIYSGRSTMVFRAASGSGAVKVVIKKKIIVKSDQDHDAVKNESSVLGSLSSKFIPKLISQFGTGDSLYTVTEDAEGQSLDRIIVESAMSFTAKLRVAVAAAEALEAVHSNGLIHRDINPSNIIYSDKNKTAQIIDFGLATFAKSRRPSTLDNNKLQGTLLYISPEQTGRVDRSTDFRSDLYSFGATLYELFLQRPPFIGADELEIIHSQIAQLATPPNEVDSQIPVVVSRIIMKLLSKQKEDRYQSAAGVLFDLKRCLSNVVEEKRLPEFELASRDKAVSLGFPEKIYGRDKEEKHLADKFQQVSKGACELVLISGRSGSGKTRLVEKFSQLVRANNGVFVAGKYDQLQGDVPYSALRIALRSLAKIVLSSNQEEFNQWRLELEKATGQNRGLLVSSFPELEGIFRAPKILENEEGDDHSRRRLAYLLAQFFQVFARDKHPLVIFLDDIQWIDAGTIRLFVELLGSANIRNLLVLGAYRAEEIDDAHLLSESVSILKNKGVNVSEIKIANLSNGAVHEMLLDIFPQSEKLVNQIAAIFKEKTNNNPFYLKELLKGVFDKGLIHYDAIERRWVGEIAQLKETSVSQNVAGLLKEKISLLPLETQEIIAFAACVGAIFETQLLAQAKSIEESTLKNRLSPAIERGFIIEVSDDKSESYKSIQPIKRSSASTYKFSHDAIQNAAHSLLSNKEQKRAHLSIGYTILDDDKNVKNSLNLYHVVDHLNRGADTLANEKKLYDLIQLNYIAATRAKNTVAYKSAKNYLTTAENLLNSISPKKNTTLPYDVAKEQADIALLLGDLDAAELFIKKSLSYTTSQIDEGYINNLYITQQTLIGQYSRAIDIGRDALSKLGIEIPSSDYESALKAELLQLPDIDFDDIQSNEITIRKMEDEKQLLGLKLLTNLFPASHFVNPALNNWIAVKMVNLSLEQGYAPETIKGFVNLGSVFAVKGDYEEGSRYGNYSVILLDKLDAESMRPRVMYAYLADLFHWKEPLQALSEHIDEAYISSIEYGDLPYAGYLLTFARCMNEIFATEEIGKFQSKVTRAIKFVRKTKNTHAEGVAIAAHLSLAYLLDQTNGGTSFDSKLITESQFIRESESRDDYAAICFFRILQAQALYIMKYYEDALSAIRSATRLQSYLSTGMPMAMLNIYSSLIILANTRSGINGLSSADRTTVEQNQNILERWMKGCEANFSHFFYLIQGEISRCSGDNIEAFKNYNIAAELAKNNQFIQFEAISYELAGKFWEELDNIADARRYLRKARKGFVSWGAIRKVKSIEQEYSFDDEQSQEEMPSIDYNQLLYSTDSIGRKQDSLDLDAVIKASQSISEEIDYESLLRRLGKITMEVAGASRYLLFLLSQERKTFELRSKVNVEKGPNENDADNNNYPQSMIDYVARTKETLLVNDSSLIDLHRDDPYFRGMGSISALCMPMLHRNNIIGVMYLENHSSPYSFSPSRLSTLEILAAQAAISIHNAELYQTLEDKVIERSQELETARKKLAKQVKKQNKEIEQLAQLKMTLPKSVISLLFSAEGRMKLGPHRAEIGVLFCDFRGFSAFSYSVQPEDASRLLEEYDQCVGELREKYQAIEDHRAGDGYMLFINDPIKHDEPIKRLVEFAFELRENINKIIEKWNNYGDELGFAIGLSFGYSDVGLRGHHGNMAYSATGEHAILASRLCDAAKDQEILTNKRIYGELFDVFEFESKGQQTYKGIVSQVSTFVVR